MQSLQHIQVKLLIYCYFLEVQTPINIKKEINIVLTLEWTCRALFWSGRIWWLPLTCLLLWLRVVAIAPTLITSYNFREKLMVIFELFLQIMANIHTLFFFWLLCEQTRPKIMQQPVLSSNLLLKCIGMNSMTRLSCQKFRHWSDNDLHGRPGELLQHFHQFCSWKAGHDAVGLQQIFHLFQND